jgi:hypothetical protein
MRQARPISLTPAMEKAVNELKGRIAKRFPQASFVIEEGFDPKGIYLVTTVDIADTDEVIDVVGDRLVELQVDEGLPIYVTPLRPIQRVVAQLREREQATPLSPLT